MASYSLKAFNAKRLLIATNRQHLSFHKIASFSANYIELAQKEINAVGIRKHAVFSIHTLQKGNQLNLVVPNQYFCRRNFYSLCQKSSFAKHSHKSKIHVNRIMAEKPEPYEWFTVGEYEVLPWTVSGIESCVVIKAPDFKLAFDMGYATDASVSCPHVFVSHGHMDHVAGIVHHATKRTLYSMKPATYHILPHLEAPLHRIAEAFSEMHQHNGDPEKMVLHAMEPGETFQMPGGILVKSFATTHRVQSQGYIVYRQRKSLKPEFVGKPSQEIGALVKSGVEVNHVDEVPEIAYTGDTVFDIFTSPPNPDLLKVKLLITESTYIDDEIKQGKDGMQRAREYGHCHLREFISNQDIFADVKKIMFVHFSDKYSVRYINKRVDELVPEIFRTKLLLGVPPLKQK